MLVLVEQDVHPPDVPVSGVRIMSVLQRFQEESAPVVASCAPGEAAQLLAWLPPTRVLPLVQHFPGLGHQLCGELATVAN